MSIRSLLTAAALVAPLCLACGQASAALAPYAQDFEGLNQASPAALGDDNWLVGANVFEKGAGANGEGAYIYDYFAYPAPNGGPAFSSVSTGASVPAGNQGLVVYSDYNNADHANPERRIQAIVFREWTIAPEDVGTIWEFSFLAAPGDLGGESQAYAFMKTLDPGAGYSTTNLLTVDTTSLPAGNSAYALELDISSGLVGQILQIGFETWASDYNPSGVNYDNINFAQVPEPGSIALLGLGLAATLRRRRA